MKFRAWDKERNQFASVASIVFLRFGSIESPNRYFDVSDEDKERFVFQFFTGYQDHKRQEIYDGDIIDLSYSMGHERDSSRDYYGEYQVIFKNGEWKLVRVKVYDEDDYDNELSLWLESVRKVSGREEFSFEKIGNIFENPELLK